MKELTAAEVERFHESVETTAYRLTLRLLEHHANSYDDVISRPIVGLDGIFAQQQAIGAKTALKRFIATHRDEITNLEQKLPQS
jgi:hypothetical protein